MFEHFLADLALNLHQHWRLIYFETLRKPPWFYVVINILMRRQLTIYDILPFPKLLQHNFYAKMHIRIN